MPPEFLNSREDAALVWLVALLAFLLCKDARLVGSGVLSLFRAFFQAKLVALFGAALACAAAIVGLGWWAGLWHPAALKPTIYWFVGTAMILVGQAVTKGSQDSSDFARIVVRKTFAATIVVEFLANLYALPLAVEVVTVGLVLTFSAMQPLVQSDPRTRGFASGVIGAVGLVYLAYFLVRVVSDFGAFGSRDTAEGFLVGPILTVALLPLLLGFARYSRWEQDRLRRHSTAAPI